MSSFSGLLEVVDRNGGIFTDSVINDIVIYSDTINNTYNSILFGCGTNGDEPILKVDNNKITIKSNSYKNILYEETWPAGTNTFKTSLGSLNSSNLYSHGSNVTYYTILLYSTPSGGNYQAWSNALNNTFFVSPTFNLSSTKVSIEESVFLELELYASQLDVGTSVIIYIWNGNSDNEIYRITGTTYNWHKINICIDSYLNSGNYIKIQYSTVQTTTNYIGIGNIKIYSVNMNSTKKYALQANSNYKNIQNIVPIGTIIGYNSSTLPSTDWKFCNGEDISQITYSTLFNIIGLNYGTSTNGNFKIPNLNAKFIAGIYNSVNQTTNNTNQDPSIFNISNVNGSLIGQNNISLTINNFPNHSHEITQDTNSIGISVPNTQHVHLLDVISKGTIQSNVGTDSHTHTVPSGTTTAVNAPHTHEYSTASAFEGSHTHTLDGVTNAGAVGHEYLGKTTNCSAEGGAQAWFLVDENPGGVTGASQGTLSRPQFANTYQGSHEHAVQTTFVAATAAHTHAMPAFNTVAINATKVHTHNFPATISSQNTFNSHTHTITNSTTSYGNAQTIPVETIPKSIAINYIIKVL